MKSCFNEERSKVWKDYMKRIMNKESDLNHNVEGDAVEDHTYYSVLDCVCRDQVVQV